MTDDKDKIVLVRIGKRLHAARRAMHLTQTELAVKAGISETHYAQVERGEKSASILIFVKILDVLGVPSNEILGK